MTDMSNIESLVLEHLRQIADDVIDLKHRISSLENAMVLVKREVNFGERGRGIP